eukprot:TRINITY_DN872_c0_g1_i1.p1 TRINITY_DN872_c0_g1~~TRINITY_DN872_c0_g1_i1.p1  ORF type:complete len:773 (-),score=269.01 TRINITY_DN872_c0_g1_i1:176-2494(-)
MTTAIDMSGVIIPPPDIKVVIDRTGTFVRKNGKQFEEEIRSRNSKTKKFQFLDASNPYFPYYQKVLQYGEAVNTTATSSVPAPPPSITAPSTSSSTSTSTAASSTESAIVEPKKEEKEEKEEKKEKVAAKAPSLKDRILAELRAIRIGKVTSTDEKPAADKFSVKIPSIYSAQDIEVVKMTAQYVARNGRSFLSSLTQREATNPQFAFLRPTHTLFSLFQQLVEAYSKIIVPNKQMLSTLEIDAANPIRILESVYLMAKFEKQQRELEDKKTVNEEEERVAMALIDWHTFVVAETINFTADEEALLPAPKNSIEEMTRMLSQQSLEDESTKQAVEEEMDTGMDVEMEDEKETKAKEEEEQKEVEGQSTTTTEETSTQRKEAVLSEPDEGPLQVISADLLERARLLEEERQKDEATKYQTCRLCGQKIAVEDLSEHLRIELLDPKWKDLKMSQIEKQRETSLAASSAMTSNLERLAKKRGDVFDVEEKEEEELPKPKKAPTQMNASSTSAETTTSKPSALAASLAALLSRSASSTSSSSASTSSSLTTMATSTAVSKQPLLPTPASIASSSSSSSATVSKSTATPSTFKPMFPFPSSIAPPPAPSPVVTQSIAQLRLQQLGFTMPSTASMLSSSLSNQPHFAPEMDMSSQPSTKKVKLATTAVAVKLLPEQEWLAKNPATVSIRVVVPQDSQHSQWKFHGQTLDFTFNLTDTVETVKTKLKDALGGMPANKMKLNFSGGSFLNKDEASLAYYNVKSGSNLHVGVKERGGKKKA